MRYCMNFYLNWHRNCERLNLILRFLVLAQHPPEPFGRKLGEMFPIHLTDLSNPPGASRKRRKIKIVDPKFSKESKVSCGFQTLSSIADMSAEVLSSSPQYINLLTLSASGSVAAAGTYRLHCQYLHTKHGGLNRMGIPGLLQDIFNISIYLRTSRCGE